MNNTVAQSNDILSFALTPPFIPLMTSVIDDTARHGLSITNYYKDPTGLLVTFGPYLNQEKNEKVSLWLNGGRTPVASELTKGESDTVELRLPLQLLKDGYNQFKCTVDRASGNQDTSLELTLLFSTLAPGGNDPDSGPGHSLLSIDVQPPSIDAAQAAQGVVITMNYTGKKLHDFIEVECNSVIVEYDLKPTPQNPDPDLSAPIELTIYTDTFKQAGDHPRFPVKYRITDQLGNTSGTDEVGTTPNPLDRWSAPVFLDVHLDRIEPEVAPTIDSVEDSKAAVIANDGYTSDTTLILRGQAKPNQLLEIFDVSTSLGKEQTDSQGNWSFTVTQQHPLKHHFLVRTLYDCEKTSNIYTVLVVLTNAPRITSVTQNGIPILSGSSVPKDSLLEFSGTCATHARDLLLTNQFSGGYDLKIDNNVTSWNATVGYGTPLDRFHFVTDSGGARSNEFLIKWV